MSRKELLIGCGHRRVNLRTGRDEWDNLTTLDNNPACKPDVLHDLEEIPYPFPDNEFDEICAQEVLEHLGTLGDHVSLFAQFSEFWRILKPNGLLIATVPSHDGLWAFGDPSHKRIINLGTLMFLSQRQYEAQCGVTAMSDFRNIYKADFEVVQHEKTDETFKFALQAIKHAT